MVSSLSELTNFYLLRLLLPLSFQTDRSNEEATGLDMEMGLFEETHFAPMTKLQVSHGK